MARLLVIGTGLIGGSFALAMRSAGCFSHIEGYDADVSAAARAAQLGVIDSAANDPDAAIAAADAVLIAVPTTGIADLVRQIAAHAGRREITVFDAGSVKGSCPRGAAPRRWRTGLVRSESSDGRLRTSWARRPRTEICFATVR